MSDMTSKKNKAAQSLARLRAKSLTKERRKEIATKAAKARWDKRKKPKGEVEV